MDTYMFINLSFITSYHLPQAIKFSISSVLALTIDANEDQTYKVGIIKTILVENIREKVYNLMVSCFICFPSGFCYFQNSYGCMYVSQYSFCIWFKYLVQI